VILNAFPVRIRWGGAAGSGVFAATSRSATERLGGALLVDIWIKS